MFSETSLHIEKRAEIEFFMSVIL